MASKRKVRRRVAKALKKYVRGNAGRRSIRKSKKAIKTLLRRAGIHKSRISATTKLNPPRVKGRKTKGGRAVTLKNFTGTIVKKSDGTVQIVGRGRRK